MKNSGRVLFKTSCTPEAQKQFYRAWRCCTRSFFPETVKAFNAIPESILPALSRTGASPVASRPNPLVGPLDAATLKRGLDAIEKGTAIGAKTAARARLAGGD